MNKSILKYSMLVLIVMVTSFFCMLLLINANNKTVVYVYANEIDSYANVEGDETEGFIKGTVSGYGEYPIGSEVTLVATPSDGCYFVEWQNELGFTLPSDTPNSYTFIVTADTQVKAIFDFIEYKVSDNFTYFDFEGVSYTADSERFDQTNLSLYPRHPESGEYGVNDTTFYYNDIITLKYKLKDSYSIVKELTSSNFSLNKPVVVIAVDGENKILWTETNVIKNYDLAGTDVASYEYDYDLFDYVVTTNVKVTDRYITTKLEIKSKITSNLNIQVVESNLKLITLSAKLIDKEGNVSDLDMSKITNTVTINYGFYGKLTDLTIFDNLQAKNEYYLAESGANYQITLSDNLDYVYRQTNGITTEKVVNGYFDAFTSGFTFTYERRLYQIEFDQIVKDGNFYTSVDRSWIAAETVELYRGENLKIDFSTKKILVNDEEYKTFTVSNTVFGYEFFGFSLTESLDTANTSFEYTVDETNPQGTKIYFVLTKIEYNFYFAVADVNGNYSEYLTARVTDLPKNDTYGRLDLVNLSVEVPYGFTVKNWIMTVGTDVTELTQTEFNFIPTSNDIREIYFLIIIEHEYFNFTFTLDGYDDLGNRIANIELSVIEHFTINDSKDVLTIYGTKYNHTQTNVESWVYDFTSSTSSENTITFTSDLGSAVVSLNDDLSFKSVLFNSLTYTYSETDKEFRRYSKNSKNVVEKTLNVNDGYNIKLKNISVDDVIFASSSLLETYSNSYKFLHFIKAELNTALPEKTAETFNNYSSVVLYGANYAKDTEISVRYVKRDGYISVTTGNQVAYNIENITFNDFLGNTEFIEGDTVKRLSITSNETVLIKIEKSLIKAGYQFVSFFVDYLILEDTAYSLGNDEFVKDDGQYFIFSFIFTDSFRDSTIVVNFEEIVYNVIIDTTAQYDIKDKDNNSILEGNVFKVTWSIINDKKPEIRVDSSAGHYIANAFYGIDEEANKLRSLMGVETSQTESSHSFTSNDLLLILTLVDNDNNLTLYIVEEERLFSITVQYLLPQGSPVDIRYVQNAEITCNYTTDEGEQSFTYKGIITTGQSSNICITTFTDIKYGTLISLEMNDNKIEGIYFSSWQNDSDVIYNKTYDFTLEDDIYIYANFLNIDYTISFVYLDKDGEISEDITSGANLTVDGLVSTYYHIGTDIQINVTEKTGYRLTDFYYFYDTSKLSFFEKLSSDEEKFYFNTQFVPQKFFSTTRDSQISNPEAKNLVIYLVFEEKIYSISSVVINSTSRGINTISGDVNNWIDRDNLEVSYFNEASGVYEQMPASEDGEVYYKTNTKLQVRFNSAYLGITLKNIYLGGKGSIITTTGNSEIANQVVSLETDPDKGDNYYILKFVLNTEILESCGNSSVFELSYLYSIKNYVMTLTSNTVNGNLLVSQYGLTLSYIPTDKSIAGEGSSSTGSKKGLQIRNNLFYASENTWTVSYEGNKENYSQDFDKKYVFRYFYYEYGNTKVSFVSSSASTNSYSFGLHQTYLDQDGNEFLLWDLIASNSTPKIVAFYEPKITFGPLVKDVEGKHIKTVNYNATVQKLTSSYDGVANPDIIYAHEELGAIEIVYTVDNGMSVEPKNANTYYVTLKVAGITFSGQVQLVINRVKLEVNHVGTISKEYDGTYALTDANIMELKTQFSIIGLIGTDTGQLDLSGISGYYDSLNVGTNILVTVNNIRLSNNLLTNYYLVEGVEQMTSKELEGSILKKKLTIDSKLFTFFDIVYKPDQEYVLKYKQNGDLVFRETLVKDDDACYIDLEKLEFTLNDYSIGYSKSVTVHLSNALSGEDDENYYIEDVRYSIDVYPYEMTYELENYGSWTITDYDEVCAIPIETDLNSLFVEVISSNSAGYPELYNLVEVEMSRSEKVHAFYKFFIKTKVGNSLNLKDFSGAYVTFNNVKKLTSLYEVGEDSIKKIDVNKVDNRIKVLIEDDTKNTFGLFVDKSYFAIWRIVLIVSLLLLLLLLIIITIIILKKVRAKKQEEKNKYY